MPRAKPKSDARQTRQNDRARRRNDAPLLRVITNPEFHVEPAQARRDPVTALNAAQGAYDAAMKSKDIIFGIGPAGTGKTWLAIQRAAEEYKAGRIKKIYLTRPNVEVGRGFGFLPGDLDEKFGPFLTPVLEALTDAFGASHLELLLKNKVIDTRPLAFISGVTLKNGWMIADEMQNATQEEFKALLTRFGEGCKMIINGDPKQNYNRIDSGLEDAIKRLEKHDEIGVIRFTSDDIVRHGLVRKIVDAYEMG